MRRQLALVLAAFALCASCQKFAEGKQMFRELLALRDQVATQFGEKVTDISVEKDGSMRMRFVNSPFAGATAAEKQKRADAVASFVAAHYKRHRVPSVTIDYVKR